MSISEAPLSRRTLLSRSAALGAALAMAGVPAGSLAGAWADIRTRPNVRVSRDRFPLHGEPSVAVNPRNPRSLLGCAMVQSGSLQSIATYTSFDGGATWHSNGPLPDVPSVYAANATVAFDPQGRGFVSAVASGSHNILQDMGVLVWRSDDGGRTFGSPLRAFNGGSDHQWLVASPGHDLVPAPLHLVWFGFSGVAYSQSLDGGKSFEPARTLPGTSSQDVGWPAMSAGPGGAVYIVFVGQPGAGGTRSPLPVLVSSSHDYGRTFSAPVEVMRQTPQPPSRPGGPLLSRCSPMITVSPSDGSIFIASIRYQAGADHTDIVVSRSRDGGKSWSRPTPISSGGPRIIYFFPKLALDGAGRLGVFAYGEVPGGIDAFLFVSEPHPMRFGPPLRLTPRPFDPRRGQNRQGSYWFGDYQGLAGGPRTFHPFWTDTRTGRMEIFTTSYPSR